MELKDIKSVYFVGAGGIGMSAIAFAEPEVRRPLKIAITNITAMAAIEPGRFFRGLEIP